MWVLVLLEQCFMSMCSYSTFYIYSDILFQTIRTMYTGSVHFQCASTSSKTRATFYCQNCWIMKILVGLLFMSSGFKYTIGSI